MENQVHSTNQEVRCDAIVWAGWGLIDWFLQNSPLAGWKNLISKVGKLSSRRKEKCVKVKPWTEDHGKGFCKQPFREDFLQKKK